MRTRTGFDKFGSPMTIAASSLPMALRNTTNCAASVPSSGITELAAMLSDRISCSRNTETAVASSCTNALAELASAISTAGKRPANLAKSMPASIVGRAGDASSGRVTDELAARERISLTSASSFRCSVRGPLVLMPSAAARRAVIASCRGAVLKVCRNACSNR